MKIPHSFQYVNIFSFFSLSTVRVKSNKAGVFKKLEDKEFFAQVYLEYGAVTWPNELDLAPDAMYDAIKKQGEWML